MSDAAADEYRWKIGKGSSTDSIHFSAGEKIIDHTFTRDVLAVAYINTAAVWADDRKYTTFDLDGVPINIGMFGGFNLLKYLYIKKGQHLVWTYLMGGAGYNISTFPIIGGGIFIDTSHPELCIHEQTIAPGESFSFGFDAIVNCNFNNSPDGYVSDGASRNNANYHVQTLNNKQFLIGSRSTTGEAYYKQMFLKAGQSITPNDMRFETVASNHKISVYPILY